MKTEGNIMKKILFDTTALVATASVAAADVTFSGYGRFGVKYSGSVAGKAAVAGTIATGTVAKLNAAIGSGATSTTNLEAIIDAYDSGTPAATNDYMTDGSALTEIEVAIIQKSIAAAQTLRAAEATLQDAGTAATLKKYDADIAAMEAFIAAASGTPAVAAIAADTLITSRLHLIINGSTESDSGVTFGATVKVQQDDGNTNAFNAARFYAKTGGLELAVGNIFGAIDSTPGLYAGGVGLTSLGFQNVVAGSSITGSSTGAGAAGTKEAAEIIYSMGDFGFHVATDGTDTEYGVSATMSGWTVALSGSDTDTAANAEWVATVGGSIGGVKLGLATAEAVSGDSSTTLSAKFDVAAATSVTVYYNDNEANTVEDKSYGLGFSHGLGGGTSLNGGIVSVNDRTMADFGVKFNF